MRVHPEPGFGAVAGETDITLRVAGLAGNQVFSRLPGMTGRPFMGRQHGIGVTLLAHVLGKILMGRADDLEQAPTLAVRGDSQVFGGKAGVAVYAEPALMAG